MLLTLTSGSNSTQYNLQYQFAASPPPRDIGTRFTERSPELIRVSGRQVAPDSGSPTAVSLRDLVVVRVEACP